MQRKELQVKVGSFLVIFLAGINISCVGGDSAFRVRGSVVNADKTAVNDCLLELYLTMHEQIVDKTSIESDFDESFVIAPAKNDYFMVVRCGEWNYKTAVFELGDVKYFRNPIDLGKIELKRFTN